MPKYLHNIDKQADELYDTLYEQLSKGEQYKKTDDFMRNLQIETEMKHIIEEAILRQIVYTDEEGRQ